MKTKVYNLKTVALLILLFSLRATAQQEIKPSLGSDYKNAIGLRIGETSGLTFKHKFSSGNAFEGILSAYPYTLGITGLYEKHFSTKVSGLQLYAGMGGHLNIGGPVRRAYYYYGDGRYYRYVYRSGGYGIGIDGIGGIEYKFNKIPLGLSADLKPFMEWNDYGYIYYSIDPSIGIKLTF